MHRYAFRRQLQTLTSPLLVRQTCLVHRSHHRLPQAKPSVSFHHHLLRSIITAHSAPHVSQTPPSRLSSTPPPPAPPPPPRRPRLAARKTLLLAAAALFGLLLLGGGTATSAGLLSTFSFSSPPPPDFLSPTAFTPFRLVARTRVSATSTLLTLRRPTPLQLLLSQPSPQYLAACDALFASSLWAVEVKQPALQIARCYTPLPPLPPLPQPPPADDERAATAADAAAAAAAAIARPGDVQLLVRPVAGGEVSRWLCGLPVGSEVGLRGPKSVVELTDSRPGEESAAAAAAADVSEPVFVVGGTGIANALQGAHALLEGKRTRGMGTGEEARVRILWASRTREDCGGRPERPARVWGWWGWGWGREDDDDAHGGERGDGWEATESGNAIAARLDGMKERYGDGLVVQRFVDEEGTMIDSMVLRALITEAKKSGGPRRSLRMYLSGPDGFVEYLAGRQPIDGSTPTSVGGVLGALGLSRSEVIVL